VEFWYLIRLAKVTKVNRLLFGVLHLALFSDEIEQLGLKFRQMLLSREF